MATPVSTSGRAPQVESSPVGATAKFRAGLTWVVIACLLLGSSAVVRGIQDRRRSIESSVQQECPFPLKELPRTLGRWKSIAYKLQLLPKLADVERIPTQGKNRIIIAEVNNLLHFRILDDEGKMAVDTDEKQLSDKAKELEALKKQLQSLWPPKQFDDTEQDQIVTDVAALVNFKTDDQKLDSKTLQITGGKEYSIRTYTDELTGVKLVVLILFGPVEPVIPHIPEICYPSNGFQETKGKPISRTVSYAKKLDAEGKVIDDKKALFKAAVYQKSRLIEGVYHSFRYDGVWSPDVGNGQKPSRLNLGVFKLQVQRLVADGESRGSEKYRDPIEDFLELMIDSIEDEISRAGAKQAPKTVVTK